MMNQIEALTLKEKQLIDQKESLSNDLNAFQQKETLWEEERGVLKARIDSLTTESHSNQSNEAIRLRTEIKELQLQYQQQERVHREELEQQMADNDQKIQEIIERFNQVSCRTRS